MKHKAIYSILFVLTVALLFCSSFQQYFRFFKFKPVAGVIVATERPQFQLKSFMNGTYQNQMDSYLSENVGFRECFIRSYNQLVWSLFHQSNNESIFVGKDDWLFNDFVMNHHKGKSLFGYAQTEEEMILKMIADARRLKTLQSILEDYGVSFFVCIAPSKDLVCDQYLPKVRDDERLDAVRAIDFYPPLFDSLGIHCLNFSDYFLQIRDTVSYPLYYKSSSHWTNLAATYLADTLIHYMESLSGLNIHDVSFSEPYLSWNREPDNDLETVLNLMYPIETNYYSYVNVTLDDDSTAVRPKWLVVGDSYYRGFQYNLPLDKLFASHHYWRYNSTVYDDPLHDNTTEVDLLRELLSSDIITILYTPCNLFDLNRQFLTQSVSCLCDANGVLNPRIDKVLNEINDPVRDRYRQEMFRNQEWLESIREKAKRSEITIEEAMERDIDWLLNQKQAKQQSNEQE